MRRLWAPEGAGLTAGHAFLLAFKHGNGDLLADLDFIRIGDIAGSGNVGIMIGRPIKAVAYLRQVVSALDAVCLVRAASGGDFVVQVGVRQGPPA